MFARDFTDQRRRAGMVFFLTLLRNRGRLFGFNRGGSGFGGS